MVLSESVPPYAAWVGPACVLSATLLSSASGWVWRRNIGETSCRWRTAYSPRSRAFAIWSLIYLGTGLSALAQLAARPRSGLLVLGWWTNALWAAAWGCCALWTPLFDAEVPQALRAAAALLGLGAAAGLAGAAVERPWMLGGAERAAAVLTSAPLTLLAGWLAVAAALGWGIAAKALDPAVDPLVCEAPPRREGEGERAYRERRRRLFRELSKKAPARVSAVPPLLAALVAGLAAAVPDPLYVLPLAWAITNLPAFPSAAYVGALLLLAGGAGVACARALVWNV
jgi:hypothetical protein